MTRPSPLPAAAPPADTELVGRIRAGDAGAMEALMRRHNRVLYRTARAILKDDAEAELLSGAAVGLLAGNDALTKKAGPTKAGDLKILNSALGAELGAGGVLFLYGPYRRFGRHTDLRAPRIVAFTRTLSNRLGRRTKPRHSKYRSPRTTRAPSITLPFVMPRRRITADWSEVRVAAFE